MEEIEKIWSLWTENHVAVVCRSIRRITQVSRIIFHLVRSWKSWPFRVGLCLPASHRGCCAVYRLRCSAAPLAGTEVRQTHFLKHRVCDQPRVFTTKRTRKQWSLHRSVYTQHFSDDDISNPSVIIWFRLHGDTSKHFFTSAVAYWCCLTCLEQRCCSRFQISSRLALQVNCITTN